MFQEFIKQHKRDHAAGEAEGGAAASNSELMETIITRELLLSQASARRRSVNTQQFHRRIDTVIIFWLAKPLTDGHLKQKVIAKIC